VVAGDFDGDGIGDLAISHDHRTGAIAIGAPSTTFNGVAAAGAVWVIDPPIGGGLDPASLSPILPQAPLSIGSPQIGEYFGNALAIADFNDDGLEDLAIGAFEYDDGSEGNAGAVQVLYQSDFLFLDGFD
jgi:hypothetical protein